MSISLPCEESAGEVLAEYDIPDSVRAIVEANTEANLDDLDAAVDASYEAISKLPDFQNLVPTMYRIAIRRAILEVRRDMNTELLASTRK